MRLNLERSLGFCFGLILVFLFLSGAASHVAAQADPCAPIRFDFCGDDAKCRADQQRRWKKEEEDCRAGKNKNNNSSEPPARPDPEAERRRAEADSRRRAEEERRRRIKTLNEAIDAEMSRSEESDRLNTAINAEMEKEKEEKQREEAHKKGDVFTAPVQCQDMESISPTQRWLYADGRKYGLKAGCNGDWAEGDFIVTSWGSDKLSVNTYLTAYVVDGQGRASTTGGFLQVINASNRFPAYFGRAGVINEKIEPGEQQTINLGIYRSQLNKAATSVQLTVKWWVEK